MFLAATTTESTWVPVQSAGGGKNTSRPENEDQSINKTIRLVEKALRLSLSILGLLDSAKKTRDI